MNPPPKGRLPRDFLSKGPLNIDPGDDPLEGICLSCGEDLDGEQKLCQRCQKLRVWDIGSIRTPLVFLSSLSMVFGFLVLIANDVVLDRFEIDLLQRADMGYLMLILSLISSTILLGTRRNSLQDLGAYKPILPFLILPLLPLPVILITTDPTNILFYLLLILIFSGSFTLIFPFRKDLFSCGPLSMTLVLSGTIMVNGGFALSLHDVDLGNMLWFMSSYHLALVGMLIIPIGGYMAIESVSLILKTVATSLCFFISFSSLVLLSILHQTNSSYNEVMKILISTIFSYFALSISFYISEVMNDLRMQNSKREIEEAFMRAEKLEERGKFFYALQQLDRAIKANPISGFGKTLEDANVIFQLEGADALFDFTFTSKEYEISLNEKAKILASQGKLAEAVKEYLEAIKRRPGYIESYLNVGMMLSSLPGKKKESNKYLNYLVASKSIYMERWLRRGIPWNYRFWMSDCFLTYRETLDRKSELLCKMGRDGDIWPYYSLVRY